MSNWPSNEIRNGRYGQNPRALHFVLRASLIGCWLLIVGLLINPVNISALTRAREPHPYITFKTNKKVISINPTIKLSGRVYPPKKGLKVYFYKKVKGGKFSYITKAKTNSKGYYYKSIKTLDTRRQTSGKSIYFQAKVKLNNKYISSNTKQISVLYLLPQFREIDDQSVEAENTLSFSVYKYNLLPTHYYLKDPHPQRMSLNAVTGDFSWKPSVDQVESHRIVIIAKNAAAIISQEIVITVNKKQEPNVEPLVNNTPIATSKSVSIEEDTTLPVILEGFDADGDSLTYKIVTQPAHGTLLGDIYFPTTDYNGIDSFTFKVNDGKVDSTPATVSINVTKVNDAPVLNAISNQTITLGSSVNLALSANDVDGDILSYSASLGEVAGNIYSWTPTSIGTSNVSITVSDGNGGTKSKTFGVTVNEVVAGGENTYYVDQNNSQANDSNPGTQDLPFKTIQGAANTVIKGTVIVLGGTYVGDITPSMSNSRDNWVTFKAAQGQVPLITGSWNLSGRKYITIDGFEVRGGFNSNPYSGDPCNDIKILNNNINGANIGINLKGYDILISGNIFNNMSNDMVRQFGDRWTIRNNMVIDESDTGDVHMDFWQTFSSSTTNGIAASYVLIENNEFINIAGSNVHFTLSNGTRSANDPTTNMIIRYNKVRNIGSLASFIDNNNSAPGNKDNSIYNNTYIDLARGTFAAWMDYANQFDASASSSGINNLFYNAMDSSGATGFLFASGGYQASNLYYDPAATMTFGGAASSEVGAIKNQNPLFKDLMGNDFSLLAGSPAINKGAPLTKVSAADLGSGNSLIVNEAEFFQPGWGDADPDWIAIGDPSNIAQISSINYETNTITLKTSIARSDGDPVYLYKDSDGTIVLQGTAPDIGAIEYVN